MSRSNGSAAMTASSAGQLAWRSEITRTLMSTRARAAETVNLLVGRPPFRAIEIQGTDVLEFPQRVARLAGIQQHLREEPVSLVVVRVDLETFTQTRARFGVPLLSEIGGSQVDVQRRDRPELRPRRLLQLSDRRVVGAAATKIDSHFVVVPERHTLTHLAPPR